MTPTARDRDPIISLDSVSEHKEEEILPTAPHETLWFSPFQPRARAFATGEGNLRGSDAVLHTSFNNKMNHTTHAHTQANSCLCGIAE